MLEEKPDEKNWFIITLLCFMGGVVCIFALPPLYFLVKRGFDIKEKNKENENVA